MMYLSNISFVSFYDVTYITGTHFSQLKNTHTLSIFKLTIDKDMITEVVKMPNLKEMYMYDCKMSPEIKQQLREALPILKNN